MTERLWLTVLLDASVDRAVANEVALTGTGTAALDVSSEAARRLDVAPARAAAREDGLAGLAAGRVGGRVGGLVVGVDRLGQRDELRAVGAEIIVDDLAELLRER